jgi:flagellin
MGADNVSLRQAIRNSNDGISLIQTAEGNLETFTSVISRLREIAVQANSETYSSIDRNMMNVEYTNLITEMKHAISSAEFNRMNILRSSGTLDLQVGIHGNSDNRITINLDTLNSTLGSLGITARIQSLDTGGGLYDGTPIDLLDDALGQLNIRRTYLGSLQNRLENALNSSIKHSEDLSNSYSKIMDTDYASESSNATKAQIMHQTGVAALGQAKALPQSILSLIS